MKSINTRRFSSSTFSRLKALRTFRRDRYLHPIASLLRRASTSATSRLKNRKDITPTLVKSSLNSHSATRNESSSTSGSLHPTEGIHTSLAPQRKKSSGQMPRSSLLGGHIQDRRTSCRQRKPSCRLVHFEGSSRKTDKSSSGSSSISSNGSSGHSSDRAMACSPTQDSLVTDLKIKSEVPLMPKIKSQIGDISPVVRIERCSVVAIRKTPAMPVLTRIPKTQTASNGSSDFGRENHLGGLLSNMTPLPSCYCCNDEQVFAAGVSTHEDVVTSDGHNYCQAIDLIDGSPVGCTRISPKDLQLRRVSARGIFMLLCKMHDQRLRLHQCCPFCEQFCTQGEDIIMCESENCLNSKETQKCNEQSATSQNGRSSPFKEYHFFHKSCSIQEIQNSHPSGSPSAFDESAQMEVIWGKISCPHCGAKGRESLREVMLEMGGPRPPIYLTEKPQMLMDISLATFAPNLEGTKSATIKFLTDNFTQSIQEACDKARSTVHRPLSPLNAKLAIEQGNLPEFIGYLAQEGDPFHIYEESNGESLAHLAVRSGKLSFLHVLCTCIEEHGKQRPFPLDIPDYDGQTPLLLGVKLNEINMVKYLLANGADCFVKYSEGSTILHAAAFEGHVEMLELLLSFVGQKIPHSRNAEGMTALGVAAQQGNSEIIKTLAGLYSSLKLLNDLDNLSRTPLHWASQNSSVESVITLIKNGAQVNAKDIDGNTPLHLAILSDSECSEGNALALLINRSDPFVENNEGQTVLDLCRDWEKNVNCKQHTKMEFMIRVIESNESIKKLHMDSSAALRILCRDISKGKEKNHPIPCVGTTSMHKELNSIISKFTYITSFVSENPTLRPDLNITNTHRCTCDSSFCSTNSYNCCVRGDGLHYSNQKLVIPEGLKKADLIIYECNDFCSCEVDTCTNRVVQKGLRHSLEVFANSISNDTLFRVRTQRLIEQGSFVCELVGELVLSSDINLRLNSQGERNPTNESNIFQLYESEEKFKILVDCQRYGNICKFMKMSSTTSNLIPVKVFVEHSDPRFPRVALFAKKDILAGEELIFGKEL